MVVLSVVVGSGDRWMCCMQRDLPRPIAACLLARIGLCELALAAARLATTSTIGLQYALAGPTN